MKNVKLKIRKLQENDLSCRVAWMNHPKVYSTMHYTTPITLEGTQKWFEKIINDKSRCDMVFEHDDKVIAMGGLTGIDTQLKKAELYIFVGPEFQSKGYGKKATMLLCCYGFEFLSLNKIYLFTNESNIGARKIYEKAGFSLEGRLRSENISTHGYEDRLYYGLLKGDLPHNPLTEPYMLLSHISMDGINIKLIRDDLYPEIGGGSKARKAIYYEEYIRKNGYNAVVTCGGIQSNHNRAIALMSIRNGWKCHLCIQGSSDRFNIEKGNALIDKMSGVEYELINPEDTSIKMDEAMDRFSSMGLKPYYIHGGGHDLPGGIAFVDAISALKKECETNYGKPDIIFHASGTGSTQAGILVGLEKVGWGDVKVIGISVARQYERGKKVISDFANTLAKYYGIDKNFSDVVLFNSDYLGGGYEKYTDNMKEYLSETFRKTGVIFDTTYSGKAFYGMMDIIKKENLVNKNIYFWHTGGIMNIMK